MAEQTHTHTQDAMSVQVKCHRAGAVLKKEGKIEGEICEVREREGEEWSGKKIEHVRQGMWQQQRNVVNKQKGNIETKGETCHRRTRQEEEEKTEKQGK